MINKVIFLLLIIISLLSAGSYSLYTQNTKLSSQVELSHSFLAAVQDSARTFKDKLGREVLEKQVMQTNLQTLTSNYQLLAANQRKLADNIKLLPRQQQKQLVNATELKQEARVSKLVSVDTTHSVGTHHWQSHTDTLSYSIRATGDTLRIDSLAIPNQLFLAQHRDSKGTVTVTATNSNPLLKNKQIDSITIPEEKPSPLLKVLLFIAGVAGGIVISH